MTIKWDEIVHFKPDEFNRPELLRPEMAMMLDDLRGEYGGPVIISSSYRDPQTNMVVGGAKDSAHLPDPTDGLYSGIDFTLPGNKVPSKDAFKIVFLAFRLGFARIGVYPKHIHLDIEKRLPQEVLWVGTD